jgi:hypothetical protein
VALVGFELSEEHIASIIRMEGISELRTSVLTVATLHHIPEDGILNKLIKYFFQRNKLNNL